MNQSINGKLFREMFVSGANNLKSNKDLIDKLNVFPVPDGDTGTNMSMTISSAIRELNNLKNDNLTEVGKTLSKGSLMGTRGNSGVILSQIIRGMASSMEGKKELGVEDLAKALKSGADTAYKAVIKPIEGTILTVVRESGEFAILNSHKFKTVSELMEAVVMEAEASLERTPNLLKNLKDAGVVDSGGKGLVCLYEGMLFAIKGQPVELLDAQDESSKPAQVGLMSDSAQNADIKFGYCTEFILESDKVEEDTIRDIMLGYGDSLVVVGYDGMIKVHVHTNNPGNALQEALKFGQLVTIKIENMRLQHNNTIIPDEEQEQAIEGVRIEQASSVKEAAGQQEKKKYGFITTTMGRGLAEIFEEFGVDIVIEGGQTMNPSTEDFMNAVGAVNADHIFILPNNSNVIMAANQAKELSDKDVYVVPTKNIPQGISSLINFEPDANPEDNMARFMESISMVKSGEVTFAVRDTIMDGIEVSEGDIIGITAKKLVDSGKDVNEVTKKLIKSMVDEDSAIVTIYYGEDVEEDSARLFAEIIQDEFDDLDVELYYGGQPLYYYLISVE